MSMSQYASKEDWARARKARRVLVAVFWARVVTAIVLVSLTVFVLSGGLR